MLLIEALVTAVWDYDAATATRHTAEKYDIGNLIMCRDAKLHLNTLCREYGITDEDVNAIRRYNRKMYMCGYYPWEEVQWNHWELAALRCFRDRKDDVLIEV